MSFQRIDMERWERREYFEHYLKHVPCSYSLTVDLDITGLIGLKLYPAMLWLLTDTVNEMEEFRTASTPEGPGIFDTMNPAYTVLNPETRRFCCGWTPFCQDRERFMRNCRDDIERFQKAQTFLPCPDMPPNTFNVSMIPWVNFTAFQLNLPEGGDYLLPIFTLGKFADRDGRRILPLALQVHHAVCDGYHVGVFLEKLQQKVVSFAAGRN